MKITKNQTRQLVRKLINEQRRGSRKTLIIDDGEGGMADESPQLGYIKETGETIMWNDIGLPDSDWELPSNQIKPGLMSLGITHIEDEKPSGGWGSIPISRW